MIVLITAPSKVERPQIDKIEKGNIQFRLTKASEANGGISHYLLIVVPMLNRTYIRRTQDYQFEEVLYKVDLHQLLDSVQFIFNDS